MKKTSSGSSTEPAPRSFYICFNYTDHWYAKLLRGYTHVFIIENCLGGPVMFEPILKKLSFQIIYNFDLDLIRQDYEVIELTVNATHKNRLIKPIFQTCATVVQYIAGISLGSILVQNLYDKLTKSSPDELNIQGISGVKVWERLPIQS